MLAQSLDNIGIDISDIQRYITDNGANMLSSGRILRVPQLSCFVHTLNLSIEVLAKHAQVIPLVRKCRKIAAHFHYSRRAQRDLLRCQLEQEITPKRIHPFVVTRWNSLGDTVETIMHNRSSLAFLFLTSNSMTAKQKRKLKLDEEQWEALSQLHQLLSPLVSAITAFQRDNDATISLVLPTLSRLREIFKKKVPVNKESDKEGASTDKDKEKAPVAETAFIEEARQVMAADFNARWARINDIYYLAALLDPRFKALSFCS